jgi:hypothetical protein
MTLIARREVELTYLKNEGNIFYHRYKYVSTAFIVNLEQENKAILQDVYDNLLPKSYGASKNIIHEAPEHNND